MRFFTSSRSQLAMVAVGLVMAASSIDANVNGVDDQVS